MRLTGCNTCLVSAVRDSLEHMITQQESGVVDATEVVERCAEQVGVVEAMPLAERATGFEQLYSELVTELERSDVGAE